MPLGMDAFLVCRISGAGRFGAENHTRVEVSVDERDCVYAATKDAG